MSITTQVLKYLNDHVRLNVFLGDIASDLGYTEQQVRSSINSMRTRQGLNIEKVAEGCWRYDPSHNPVVVNNKGQASGAKLFELIGQSKNEKYVLQDEDGELYVAEKL